MMSHHLSDRVRSTLCLALAAAIAFGVLAQPIPASAQSGGTIEGLVYADLDGDGQSGPDEPGLPGIIIRLTDDNNTSKTLLTGLNGAYVFDDLE
ncbi:MAG TPA: SdrD B-like domain-containing protein, partial [Methylomirabilota bacterium]|nr:SdrD B-like domain-containing protein [Methylomirabilota bacterium]